jgi:HNH endonuclease
MISLKEKLLANSKLDEKTECIEWQKFRNPQGYGSIHLDGRIGKVWRVHRLMWTIEMGEIPKGQVVRHLCHNPACININHLAIGTQKENVNDMYNAGRKDILKGSRLTQSKLTEAQVEEIRFLYERKGNGNQPFKNNREAFGYGKLALMFNVSRGTIWKIIKGRNWRHVT